MVSNKLLVAKMVVVYVADDASGGGFRPMRRGDRYGLNNEHLVQNRNPSPIKKPYNGTNGWLRKSRILLDAENIVKQIFRI